MAKTSGVQRQGSSGRYTISSAPSGRSAEVAATLSKGGRVVKTFTMYSTATNSAYYNDPPKKKAG